MHPPAPGPGETLDRLAGDWWIYQQAGGHRWSTDDLLTAWAAIRARPGARRVLDLGSGIGAIGLLCLLRLPPGARLVGVEIQALSAGLARRTAALNGLAGRVEVRCGDLRDPRSLPAGEAFELIVSSPPYLPPERATRSPHPQRAAARLELHGDVFDTCRVAAAHLAHDGRLVFSHAAADPRPPRAVAQAGLVLLGRREVVFRVGRAPAIALFECAWRGARRDPEPLTVRDARGRRSPQFRALRREMLIEA